MVWSFQELAEISWQFLPTTKLYQNKQHRKAKQLQSFRSAILANGAYQSHRFYCTVALIKWVDCFYSNIEPFNDLRSLLKTSAKCCFVKILSSKKIIALLFWRIELKNFVKGCRSSLPQQSFCININEIPYWTHQTVESCKSVVQNASVLSSHRYQVKIVLNLAATQQSQPQLAPSREPVLSLKKTAQVVAMCLNDSSSMLKGIVEKCWSVCEASYH